MPYNQIQRKERNDLTIKTKNNYDYIKHRVNLQEIRLQSKTTSQEARNLQRHVNRMEEGKKPAEHKHN